MYCTFEYLLIQSNRTIGIYFFLIYFIHETHFKGANLCKNHTSNIHPICKWDAENEQRVDCTLKFPLFWLIEYFFVEFFSWIFVYKLYNFFHIDKQQISKDFMYHTSQCWNVHY